MIWSRRVAKDIDAPFRTRFILLTTGAAPTTRPRPSCECCNRDELAADKRLLKVVATSKSKENAGTYESYAALPEELRLSLLRAINVLELVSEHNRRAR